MMSKVSAVDGVARHPRGRASLATRRWVLGGIAVLAVIVPTPKAWAQG